MKGVAVYFLTGELFTTLIVVLEQSGSRWLSGLMTLIPVFTLVSYIFIGQTEGGLAIFFVLATIFILISSHYKLFQ